MIFDRPIAGRRETCRRYSLDGHPAWWIAARMETTPRTIERYRRWLREHYGPDACTPRAKPHRVAKTSHHTG